MNDNNDKLTEKKLELEYIKDQINCSLFAGNREAFLKLSDKEKKCTKEIRIIERRIKLRERMGKKIVGGRN